jgi:YVTN family beta-propeller protein
MTIPVGESPVGEVFDGANVWVADENGENIYEIKASTGSVTHIYPGGHGAQYLAFDGVNDKVWVTNPASDDVTVIDVATGALSTYPSGNDPDGIAFDGVYMWVANFTPAAVTKIRASDGTIVDTVSVGTSGVSDPRLLVYDDASKHVWVTLCGDNKIAEIDAATDAVVGDFDLPGSPYAIAFDGACLWVTQAALNTVAKVDTGNGAVVGTYDAGIGPNGIDFDGSDIWITDQVYEGAPPFPMDTVCTVTRLRASDGESLGAYRVGERPQWVTTGDGYFWVTNGSDNTVSRFPY